MGEGDVAGRLDRVDATGDRPVGLRAVELDRAVPGAEDEIADVLLVTGAVMVRMRDPLTALSALSFGCATVPAPDSATVAAAAVAATAAASAATGNSAHTDPGASPAPAGPASTRPASKACFRRGASLSHAGAPTMQLVALTRPCATSARIASSTAACRPKSSMQTAIRLFPPGAPVFATSTSSRAITMRGPERR